MNKAVVFGCGTTGKRAYEQYKNQYDIVAFLDNDLSKAGTMCMGKEVFHPTKETIESLNVEYYIVASVYGRESITDQLYKFGIADENIKYNIKMPDVLTPFLTCLKSEFEENNIKGNCVELGVYKGDSARIINNVFSKRVLYLFDTFEGFDERDFDVETNRNVLGNRFNNTSEEYVKSRMPYPQMVVIKKGYFPDTANGIEDSFCFVRLDADLYKPTIEGLHFFGNHMAKGGVIVVHDYFGEQYPGVKRAVKEYMSGVNGLHLLPMGDSFSVVIVGF